MTFYIQPPVGIASLISLDEYATKRLDFLIEIANNRGSSVAVCLDKVTKSDCLIEGSKKDALSHFILR